MKALVGAFNQEKAVWNRWIVCSTSLQFQIIRLYRSASCSVVSPLLLPHHLELLGQCTLIIVMRHSLTLISLVRLQIELIKTFIIHVHVLPKFQSLNAILSFSPSCNSCWVTHYACYVTVSGPGLGVPVSPCRGVASYRVSGSGLELCRVKDSALIWRYFDGRSFNQRKTTNHLQDYSRCRHIISFVVHLDQFCNHKDSITSDLTAQSSVAEQNRPPMFHHFCVGVGGEAVMNWCGLIPSYLDICISEYPLRVCTRAWNEGLQSTLRFVITRSSI